MTPDQFSSVADQMPSTTKTAAATITTHEGTRSMARCYVGGRRTGKGVRSFPRPRPAPVATPRAPGEKKAGPRFDGARGLSNPSDGEAITAPVPVPGADV
jgi:hypothetical protein